MRNKKKRRQKRKGTVLIISGLLCIFGAMGLFGYNMYDSNRAGQASAEVLEELNTDMDAEEAVEKTKNSAMKEDLKVFTEREMPAKVINGYRYIGVLSVPSEGLELPVMEEWDYSRLRIAPCRYSGSAYAKDLVIAGHNYYRHFSRLKWIAIGEKVNFTDVDGNVFHYVITNKETLKPTMVEDLVEDENEEWDLTLFTCNTGGQTRCVIRCECLDEFELEEEVDE